MMTNAGRSFISMVFPVLLGLTVVGFVGWFVGWVVVTLLAHFGVI